MIRFFTIVFGVLFMSTSIAQFYSGSYQEFGKNRVQYNQFLWKNQNFERFKIHYYPGEESLVEYCAKTFHAEMKNIEKFFDFTIDDHLDIIVFSSKSQFNQSNVGITKENNTMVGGLTRVVGAKLFVFYEGTHEQLNRQIRATIAEFMLNKMLFEGDWKDVLKANALASFPEWYINGFVSFMSRPWDADLEARVKDGFLSGRFDDFSRLEGEEAELAGHAMWHFIDLTFGRDVIPNIIYLTRITRNPDRGFKNVIGGGVTELTKTMLQFYKTNFSNDLLTQEDPDSEQINFKRKKERIYYGFKVSPNGKKMAYVENHLGRYKVIIHDLLTNKRKVIYRAEPKLYRTIDKTYPVLAWHPQSEALAFVNERKGELRFHIHTFNDGKTAKRVLQNLDKVLSMDYSNDGRSLVFSAAFHGFTNLYLYTVQGNAHKKITDDRWDDCHPKFVDNSTKIIFVSNRKRDTLGIDRKDDLTPMYAKRDVFLLNVSDIGKHYVPLTRITNTPHADEQYPFQVAANQYGFLSDENGVHNRFYATRDSVISHVDTMIHYRYLIKSAAQTNWNSSALEIDYNHQLKKVYTLIFRNNKYKVIQSDSQQLDKPKVLQNVTYKSKEILRSEQRELTRKRIDEQIKQYEDSSSVKTVSHIERNLVRVDSNYRKQIIVIGERKNQATNYVFNNQQEIDPFAYERPREVVYSVNFAKDYFVAQLDNQFMNQTYQRYSGPGTTFFNPGLNALMSIGFSDVFEDYKLVGGMRVPFDFNSSEFLGEVYFLKKRLDHRLILYRQSMRDREQATGSLFKWNIHEIKHVLSYPFSETLSLRGVYGYRFDQNIVLAMNDQSLSTPNRNFHQANAKLELVFDNARLLQLNTWSGTKFKFFVEYMNQFSPNRSTWNIGFDFRHYQRLVKNFVWVNRFAGATSLGNQRVVYYMGGVDNWMIRPDPHFDANVEVDPSQPYGYQTLASPMRGFLQNSRNGNSFAVWNSELRLPIFSFFSKYPVKSEFLRSFQLIGFMDLGTAWTGKHPYSSENYFNTQTIEQKPITIKLENAREPLILGFGTGIRAMLFGYFMRLDCGWGLNDGFVSKRPRLQFSLGFDI